MLFRSLPLAALFFKLLGGILPTRFQYFGWWGLLCYALQGGLAQAVIARIAGVQPTFGRDDKSKAAIAIIMSPGQTAKLWGSVLGAGVLVLFPALTIRMFAHTALAANWLVLLALYLWLRSDELMPTTRRACLIWGGMGLLCAGIHLYYLPMVGLVLVGYAVRRALQKRGFAAAILPVAAFCVTALAELSEDALVQILTEPKNALVKQYSKLLAMEGVELEIRPAALKAIAGATV